VSTPRMGSITAELARGSGASRATAPTDATEPTKPNVGGRPKRAGGYSRLHITLDPELANYINEAWRTHRRTDGSYVNGPSGFVEDILVRYRAANEKS
jgi:hypothetical protein